MSQRPCVSPRGRARLAGKPCHPTHSQTLLAEPSGYPSDWFQRFFNSLIHDRFAARLRTDNPLAGKELRLHFTTSQRCCTLSCVFWEKSGDSALRVNVT
jgi:hypothetical protein